MIGYLVGTIMLCAIMIACAIKFVYDMVKPYESDSLYEDMKNRIVNTLNLYTTWLSRTTNRTLYTKTYRNV